MINTRVNGIDKSTLTPTTGTTPATTAYAPTPNIMEVNTVDALNTLSTNSNKKPAKISANVPDNSNGIVTLTYRKKTNRVVISTTHPLVGRQVMVKTANVNIIRHNISNNININNLTTKVTTTCALTQRLLNNDNLVNLGLNGLNNVFLLNFYLHLTTRLLNLDRHVLNIFLLYLGLELNLLRLDLILLRFNLRIVRLFSLISTQTHGLINMFTNNSGIARTLHIRRRTRSKTNTLLMLVRVTRNKTYLNLLLK